jgi:hypothetical protein
MPRSSLGRSPGRTGIPMKLSASQRQIKKWCQNLRRNGTCQAAAVAGCMVYIKKMHPGLGANVTRCRGDIATPCGDDNSTLCGSHPHLSGQVLDCFGSAALI